MGWLLTITTVMTSYRVTFLFCFYPSHTAFGISRRIHTNCTIIIPKNCHILEEKELHDCDCINGPCLSTEKGKLKSPNRYPPPPPFPSCSRTSIIPGGLDCPPNHCLHRSSQRSNTFQLCTTSTTWPQRALVWAFSFLSPQLQPHLFYFPSSDTGGKHPNMSGHGKRR